MPRKSVRRYKAVTSKTNHLNFVLIGIATLLAFAILNHQQQFITLTHAVPNETDRDAFYNHIQKSSGSWESADTAEFEGAKIAVLPPAAESIESVLSSTTAADGSEKWIEVDISDQTLKAWEGSRKVYEFRTSTGRNGYETVKGEFRVWRKVKYQRYVGGSKVRGDYYNLPNVPFSLFFHKGYAIHGAYWHNDFGVKRRSSGCVNLRPNEAEQIFNWAGPNLPAGVNALNSSTENPGVRIVVHD